MIFVEYVRVIEVHVKCSIVVYELIVEEGWDDGVGLGINMR